MIKGIEAAAQKDSEDPLLVAMAERARDVQQAFEDRQSSTSDALERLIDELKQNEQRLKDQAASGFDALTFFVVAMLDETGVSNAETVSVRIRDAFLEHPHWRKSEGEMRELRKRVTFAIFAECEDLEQVTALVNRLFTILTKPNHQ